MAANSFRNAVMKLSLIACVMILFALPSGALAFSCSQAPGLRYPLIDWRSVNGGALPQTFTYGMKEDAFAVTIEAGTLQNVGPDEMIVILESAGSWMWRKEIWSFNSFTGLDLAAPIIRTDVGSPGPVSMRLTRAECGSSRGTNTIVFWKIDALGLFTRDMYHLDIDHFWSTLGGTIVTFRWLEDNYGDPHTDPQYPPKYLSPFMIPFDRNLAAVSGFGGTYNRIDLFETVTSLHDASSPLHQRIGSLNHSWWDGSWSDENIGWTWNSSFSDAARPLSAGPAAAYRGVNDIDVFVRDDCNRLFHVNGPVGTSGWYWHVHQDPRQTCASQGGGLTSSPAAVAWGSHRYDVVARGEDFAFWHLSEGHLQGHDWQPLGGAFTSAPAIVSSGTDRLDVFGRGMDNALWMNSWTGSAWTGWSSLGGILTSDPAAVVYGTAYGTAHIAVFARGTDNALWVIVDNGSGWGGWGSLGGILTSAPAATARDGHIDVFVRGTDDKVWQKSWTSPWARGYGGQPAWSGSIGWGAWSQPALPFCTAC